MKRVAALIVDVFVMTVLTVILGMVLLLMFRRLPALVGNMLMQITIFLYTFLCDYCFHGVTVGKKMANLEIVFSEPCSKLKFSAVHAFCRTIAISLSIFSLLFYICKDCSMPYDKWLKMQVVDKKASVQGH